MIASTICFKVKRLGILFTLILILISNYHLNANKNQNFYEMPDFEVFCAKGQKYNKKDFKGELGFIIIFLSNHCKISQSFEPYLEKKYIEWKEAKINLFVISPNNENAILPDELAYTEYGVSLNDIKNKVKMKKIEYPYIYDGDTHNFVKKLNPKLTPVAYLFNSKGDLKYSGKIGDYKIEKNIDDYTLEKNIRKLKSEMDFEYIRSNAYGTNIKLLEDTLIAEAVKKRHKKETINLFYADEKKVDLIFENNLNQPTLFYIWKISDDKVKTKLNLEIISRNFKIFRKRGARFFTFCIESEQRNEKSIAQSILKSEFVSTFNFILSTHNQENIRKQAFENLLIETPAIIIRKRNGNVAYSKNGIIEETILKHHFIKELNKKQ